MTKTATYTPKAPAAIGPYSQAVRAPAGGELVFLSGQIPLDPTSMELVSGGIREQAVQVLENLRAVCEAAGGGLDDIVKLSIYLCDLGEFASVNEVMADYFREPYPARATVEVTALPKDAQVEIEAVMVAGKPV